MLSLQLLIFSATSVIVLTGFIMLVNSIFNISVRSLNKITAFSVAEAGIEYYRWHLAHNQTDYQDGTGGPGPYVHNYYDKNGVLIGKFSLEIIPPPISSTIVTIKSTGTVMADSSIKKIIQVKMGIPSFAKYAWVLNSDVNFGASAEVFGVIHSNFGIRFDGLAHNLITSAQLTYNDPDHSGANEFGIHTHKNPVDPLPPATVPSRPDVFMTGRQFPIPAVDFTGITQTLAQIRTNAQTNGFYASSSSAFGYDVELKTDDTFNIYRVTQLVAPPSNCSSSSQSGWGTWSIQSEILIGNYPFPNNGLIFLEDHVWVRGQINTARLTIVSGRLPFNSTDTTSITVNNDLRYTNYNGLDTIALIAQNNINVGLFSNDILRIDGALMAQNGRVGRYSYGSNCGANRVRAELIFYGMLGSNQRPGFAYSSTNGYQSRIYTYDSNLLYAPPPSFPLSSDQYIQISWDELQ